MDPAAEAIALRYGVGGRGDALCDVDCDCQQRLNRRGPLPTVKKGQGGIARYWAEKNQNTIDGVPTNIVAKSRAGSDGQCGAS